MKRKGVGGADGKGVEEEKEKKKMGKGKEGRVEQG